MTSINSWALFEKYNDYFDPGTAPSFSGELSTPVLATLLPKRDARGLRIKLVHLLDGWADLTKDYLALNQPERVALLDGMKLKWFSEHAIITTWDLHAIASTNEGDRVINFCNNEWFNRAVIGYLLT